MMKLTTFLMVCLAALPSHAAILKILQLDQMTDQSHAIVQGRVEASRVQWDETHSSIVTVYTVRAGRYWNGFLGENFDLVEPGGVLDGLAMSVPGAPHFRIGEEAVLFVWTDPARGHHQAIGFEQGVFRLHTDGAGNRLVTNRWLAGLPARMPVEAFLSKVTGSLARVAVAKKARGAR